MGNFFDTDNFYFRWISRITDFLILSCLWLLCCLPMVTIIPASIALYDSISRCVYGPDGGTYKRFFRTFWKELRRGIPMTLLWALIAAVLSVGYQILYRQAAESTLRTIFSLVYLCLLFIPAGTAAWAIVLESRFVYSFGTLHRNAFIFTFAYLPHTAALVALLAAAAFACIKFPPLILLIPGLMVFLQAVFAERVLKKYMPEE